MQAFCLTGNHYRLLVRTPAENFQRMVRRFNGACPQRHTRMEEVAILYVELIEPDARVK